MRFAVQEIPRPSAEDDTPHPWLVGVVDITREYVRDLYGHDDFVTSPQASQVWLRGGDTFAQRIWVALPADHGDAPTSADVIGFL